MDIPGVVEYLRETNQLSLLTSNALMQFGPINAPLLGAEFLPERNVESIEYTEEDMRIRAVIANDGTRYNPVQKKSSVIVGSRTVRLGHSDIGDEMKASDYDALVRLLRQTGEIGINDDAPPMAAVAKMIDFGTAQLMGLKMKNEKQRWEALLHGQVVRKGNDKYQETVVYPTATGQRVGVGGTWSNSSYDPYTDIMPIVEFLRGKGFEVNRIVTDITTSGILALNAKMTARIGRLGITSGTVVNNPAGRVTAADLSAAFSRDGLPPVELYDRQYRTQTGTGYYFDRGYMFFACTTGRNAEIDRGDLEPLILEDTIGYTGVGPAAGQSMPGASLNLFPHQNHPPRVEAEAVQSSLPVLEDPEAFAVLSGIA